MRALLLHEYPGNVRELENLIQRAVVLSPGPMITAEDLPTLAGGAASAGEPLLAELLTMPMEQALRELERLLIVRALVKASRNKTEAARLLQIRRQQLCARISELGIECGSGQPRATAAEKPSGARRRNGNQRGCRFLVDGCSSHTGYSLM